MWRSTPLVTALLALSLVILVLAESNNTNLVPMTTWKNNPIILTTLRPPTKRQRRRRTTTTTTTTTEMYDDDDMTSPATTTMDPRTLDHTEVGSCEVPLGMESGMISNESLSASSSYDQSVSPLSARIRTEHRGGAWCPNGLISPRSHQYIEIDLHDEYLITATESQGRFANAIGVEFVESYALEYWRDSLMRWVKYNDFNGSRLIPGNVNTYVPRKTVLEAPFVASKVRFLPYAAHPRTACMRVELYGCRWKQALTAYSAPQGSNMVAMAGGAKFEDLSYDGVLRENRLQDGLGQISDSFKGPNDFELLDTTDTQGTRWVGWNRTKLQADEVKLTFNFTGPRMFMHVDFHTNNMFTKDVQLFKEAEVFFSLEGERWQEECISLEPKQDRVSEHARIVHIDLENRTAKYLMVKLRFQHEWILISEATFRSLPTKENNSAAFLEDYYRTDNPPNSKKKRNQHSLRVSIGLGCGGLIGGSLFIAAITVLLARKCTAENRRRIPNILKQPFCLSRQNNNNRNRRPPRIPLSLSTCPPIHMRPAVVDEDYREPYNIWRETLGRRDKREEYPDVEQNEYEMCEEPDIPRPYMMKRPDPTEYFYAATDIIHRNVEVCETDGIEVLSDEESPTTTIDGRRLVVVKSLWPGCHNDIKTAFFREATWGAGLKHPNLARVFGLNLQEPPCAALDRGDANPLPYLFKMNRKLNYASLIHITCQIASAMKYLESLQTVHRDLAARNIIVTQDLTVQMADYAMFCDEFEEDYHIRPDGTRLPLRWMAWETLLLGMSSSASDVWAFGVTVWEILTNCTEKPYAEMTDDQVLDNAAHWRSGRRAARVPAISTPRCRRELYDLMHECWQREPMHRPRFHDLHKFLESMNQGYKPPTQH